MTFRGWHRLLMIPTVAVGTLAVFCLTLRARVGRDALAISALPSLRRIRFWSRSSTLRHAYQTATLAFEWSRGSAQVVCCPSRTSWSTEASGLGSEVRWVCPRSGGAAPPGSPDAFPALVFVIRPWALLCERCGRNWRSSVR